MLIVSGLKMLQVDNSITGVIAIVLCAGAAAMIVRGRRATLAAESAATPSLDPAA